MEIEKVFHNADGSKTRQIVKSNGAFVFVSNQSVDTVPSTPNEIVREFFKRTRRPVPLKELAKGVCK